MTRNKVLYCCIVLAALGILQASCISSSSKPFYLLSTGEMLYPQEAKDRLITGWVTVKYDILIDGSVDNVTTVDSQPEEIFDAEAIRFVKTWLFSPARFNGVPVQTNEVESTITFELDELNEQPSPY